MLIPAAAITASTVEEAPDRGYYCWYFDGWPRADYNFRLVKG